MEPETPNWKPRLILSPEGSTVKVRRPDGTWAEVPILPRWTYKTEGEGH